MLTAGVVVVGVAPRASAATDGTTSSQANVDSVQARPLATHWSAFVAQSPHKPAVAVETSTHGRLGEAYFAFPTARDAAAFEAKPTRLALVQARRINPGRYILADQDGFTEQKLDRESTVYTFRGGVGIFLQQGSTVVVGTYLGAPPAHRAGYDLLSLGLSQATQKAAAFLTTKST